MSRLVSLLTVCLTLVATGARAEFTKIDDEAEFLRYVNGMTLTRPFVNLRVTQDGKIAGMGARWEVTGNWAWVDGYFCRDLFWGGDELGYNCQEVRVDDGRLRFTSDKGAGMSAVFRLRQRD